MKIGIIPSGIREGRRDRRAVGPSRRSCVRGSATSWSISSPSTPLLTSARARCGNKYDDERVTRWSRAIDSCDGYVFVTPEYNHGVPGGLKNAFDVLGGEWADKAVAFVSYGAEGGVRAVEHWRQIVANFRMFGVRQQVSLSTFTEFDDGVAPAGAGPGDRDAVRPAENATPHPGRPELTGARRARRCRVCQFSAASAAS